MTFRAVIVGLAIGMCLAGVGYYNDRILELESLTAGHLLPISVMGMLFLAMAVANPLVFCIRPRWAFRPAEVATALAILLVSCSIPGRGLMEQFTQILAMPPYWAKRTPGWRKLDLMKHVPPAMLAGGNRYDEEVMHGFNTGGLGKSGRHIGLDRVPWGKWVTPLATWVPLLVLLAVSATCVALIVHRQWSRRERLRYPIAEFATSLIDRDPARAMGPIYRNRRFWIGLAIVLGLHLINGLHKWYPQDMIRVDMTFDLRAIGRKWPLIPRSNWGTGWMWATLYPTVIAFSFFLASDISLSLGLTQVVYVPIAMIMATAGVEMGSSYMAGGPMGWHRSGSYFAFALILIYIGRRYYWDLFCSAVTLRRRQGVQGYEAWACRILFVALAAAIVIIIRLGLDWPLAILTVLLMMMMFLGVSRIGAETGLFFIQPRWQPMGVLLGLFGAYALGPEAIIMAGLLCAVLSLDPSMALMPHMVNALKICDNAGVPPRRVGWSGIATYAAGIAVAVPIVLWINYDVGTTRYDWSYRRVPTMPFRPAAREADKLALAGQLQESENLSPLERLRNIRPQTKYLWGAVTGFALVFLVSLLRLRFSWWPLHPVMFLVWATWPVHCFFHSFLLGWLIKTIVMRLGGHKTYRSVKPLMIGAIAGDLLGALTFMIAGAAYYAYTGAKPINYVFFPR